MDIIIYLGALFIFLLPYFNRNIHFVDILILFFLYFDVMMYFIQHKPTFNYFENMMMLLFATIYLVQIRKIKINYFAIVFVYILIILLFPFIQGDNINQSIRIFSIHFSSLIVLPIAFHHYSTRGKIDRLFNSIFWFIVIWCLFVLVATPFKLGGEGSERVGGTFFYFGMMGNRGGLTYISFMLLTVPLIIKYLTPIKKYILFALVLLILIIFAAVLKRFVFFVLAFGLFNYLIKSSLKLGYKLQLLAIFVIFAALLVTNRNLQNLFEERYVQRGGEREFSEEAITTDLRIYEPYYVFQEIRQRNPLNILIGSKQRAVMDIQHNEVMFEEREIHNEYATIALKSGIIGLIIYLSIFITLYLKTSRIRKKLNRFNIRTIDLWIVFQNILLLFVIEGMVGGHIHVTFRGSVFLLTGAISGVFYRLLILNKRLLKEKASDDQENG